MWEILCWEILCGINVGLTMLSLLGGCFCNMWDLCKIWEKVKGFCLSIMNSLLKTGESVKLRECESG